MIVVPIVLLLLVVIGVVVVMKAKSSKSTDGDFLETDRVPRPEAPKVMSRAPIDPLPAFTPEPVVTPEPAVAPEPAAPVAPVAPVAEPVAATATPAELAPEPLVKARIEPVTPTPAELAPEPMVKARIAPAAPVTPVAAVPTPVAPVVADSVAAMSPVGDEDEEEVVLSRFKVAGKPHLDTIPAAEPEPVAVEPEPVAVEPDPEPVAVEPEPVAVEPEPVAVEPEPVAVDPQPVAVDPEPEPAVAETEPEPAVAETELVLADFAAEPEPIAAQAEAPLLAQLQPEPETDPVDHVLKALISRAKSKQVGIAEVAAELVEQANLEDRDIDEVLADLVDRVDEEENVAAGDRLQELTLFNDSVPRRPGQLTDFDRLDKIAKKRVIIRVLCLLVAMQEDNRLTPSAPRSEAETRHWPLSRAVWPVPAAKKAEDEDDKKNLPGRRLTRSKP